jgi:hypothetical protein
MKTGEGLGRAMLGVVVLIWASSACESRSDGSVPTGDEIASYYKSDTRLSADLTGNVAAITVQQSPAQLRRGGTLWAKVGPYVYLFTEETFRLFEDFPGLAAVRVTTEVSGQVVASALLERDALSGVLWRRSLNIAGRARRDGSIRMTLLEDLVAWGEDHTSFDYNPTFVGRP